MCLRADTSLMAIRRHKMNRNKRKIQKVNKIRSKREVEIVVDVRILPSEQKEILS